MLRVARGSRHTLYLPSILTDANGGLVSSNKGISLYLREVFFQLFIKNRPGGARRLFFKDEDYSGGDREDMGLRPCPFARAAAQAIAHYRPFINRARSNQRQARIPAGIGQDNNAKKRPIVFSPQPENALYVF